MILSARWRGIENAAQLKVDHFHQKLTWIPRSRGYVTDTFIFYIKIHLSDIIYIKETLIIFFPCM